MATTSTKTIAMLFGVAGASIISWTLPFAAFLSLLAPVWAWRQLSRRRVFVVMATYYAAATITLPASARIFFDDTAYFAGGIMLWVAHSALLAGVWALIWTERREPWRVALALLTTYLLISLPPIGVFGWLNPLLGAGDWLPGLGLPAMGIAILFQVALIAPPLAKRAVPTILGVAIFVGVLANITTREPMPPAQWLGVDMHQGSQNHDAMALLHKNTSTDRAVLAKVAPSTEVVVVPEQVLGTWDIYSQYYWTYFQINKLKDRPVVMVLGAAIKDTDKHYRNAAIVMMRGKVMAVLSSRQNVPFSMWRPYDQFAKSHYPARWNHRNTITMPDGAASRRTTFLLCYEEVIMWPMLQELLFEEPEVIVSMTNSWWDQLGMARQVQYNHVRLWSRLAGVPMVRAVNYPSRVKRGEAPR